MQKILIVLTDQALSIFRVTEISLQCMATLKIDLLVPYGEQAENNNTVLYVSPTFLLPATHSQFAEIRHLVHQEYICTFNGTQTRNKNI